ncbi:MAG: (d)CMP kinase [Chitinophagaceae bacterium]
MKKIIITVDGYSSCGKSTMAKALAKELNYVFVDSGAMYRAITLYFLRNNVALNDAIAVENALNNISLRFEYQPEKGSSDIFLNNENVENAIREMFVAEKVSAVAAIPAVRTFAVAQQQLMGEAKGIVMDGRDIGTTVFPQAELKIFVTADVDVRVQRRLAELQLKNPSITAEEVKENLQSRDLQDSTREVSPLRKAADAIVLDNSFLNREEQLALALTWAKGIIASN